MNFLKQLTEKIRNKQILKKINAEISEMRRIENISSSGFEIYDLEYNLKDRFSRSKIKTIKFSSGYKSLMLTDVYSKTFYLNNDINNWYALIQKIPEGYENFDYNYVSDFVKDFEYCEVCGMKAVKNNTCLHCYSGVWNNDLQEDYPDKESYIKSEQLDLYSITSKLASVNFKRYDNSGFEKNPDFFPSVTKDEVPDYSNKYFINPNK